MFRRLVFSRERFEVLLDLGGLRGVSGRLRTSGHRFEGRLLLSFKKVSKFELGSRYCYSKVLPEGLNGLQVKAKVRARKRTTTTTAAPPLGQHAAVSTCQSTGDNAQRYLHLIPQPPSYPHFAPPVPFPIVWLSLRFVLRGRASVG